MVGTLLADLHNVMVGAANKPGENTSTLDNGAVLFVMKQRNNDDRKLRSDQALSGMVTELQKIRCMLADQENTCKVRRLALEDCICNIQEALRIGRGVTSSTSASNTQRSVKIGRGVASSSSSSSTMYVPAAKRMKAIGERG